MPDVNWMHMFAQYRSCPLCGELLPVHVLMHLYSPRKWLFDFRCLTCQLTYRQIVHIEPPFDIELLWRSVSQFWSNVLSNLSDGRKHIKFPVLHLS